MTQNWYWWLAGIAAFGMFIITLIKAAFPPLSRHWNKRQRDKHGINATAFPQVFAPDPLLHVKLPTGEIIPYKLHGFAVELTGNADEPYEVVGVELRLNGVDLSSRFMEGWSQSTDSDKEIIPEHIKDSFCAVEMRLEHGKALVSNSSDNNGFKLAKNKKVRFFTPIQIPIVALAVTIPNCVSIVARTTEGDKTVLSGQHLWSQLKETFDNWKLEPLDPDYECRITLHTTRRQMPINTRMVNTLNDKPITIVEKR